MFSPPFVKPTETVIVTALDKRIVQSEGISRHAMRCWAEEAEGREHISKSLPLKATFAS